MELESNGAAGGRLSQEWIILTYRKEWRTASRRIVWVAGDGVPLFSYTEEF